MSNGTLAWPKGHRVAVVVSVLLETWTEGKSPSYFPRTTPLVPGAKDVAGINWSRFGGNEGIWRLARNLKDEFVSTEHLFLAIADPQTYANAEFGRHRACSRAKRRSSGIF